MTYRAKSRTKRLGVGEQAAWIRKRWGANWTTTFNAGRLVSIGLVQPDELSCRYQVQVSYAGSQPSIKVLQPPLETRGDGKPIPHTYRDDKLCLYRPKYEEWEPSLLIADTIIPWVSEWLFYYEIWLVTGLWLGGGEHPTSND